MDELDQIIDSANRRDAAAYDESIRALDDQDRRIVLAHVAFAALHGLICTVASKFRAHGRPVRIERQAYMVSITSVVRSARCTCYLNDDNLIIEFFGDPTRSESRIDWRPPTEMDDPRQAYQAMQRFQREIARHLTT